MPASFPFTRVSVLYVPLRRPDLHSDLQSYFNSETGVKILDSK